MNWVSCFLPDTTSRTGIIEQTPCSKYQKMTMCSWQWEKKNSSPICVLLNALAKALQAQMGRYMVCTFKIKTKIAENYIHGWQGTENPKISKNNST